jgi:hypothetical protein
MPQQPTDWVLANDHASTPLVSLVYDPTDKNMLVAALCSFTAAGVYTALKAQMEKNNSAAYSMKAIPESGNPILLSAAGRGYITDKQTFDEFHARAFAASFIHKKAGDPRFYPGAAFYIVQIGDQAVEDLFMERLIAVTPLPLLREWKGFLISAGRKKKLVSELPVIGQPGIFKTPLKVSAVGWDNIVTEGLQNHLVHFEE